MSVLQHAGIAVCPDWCIAPHDEDTSLHYQADQAAADTYGKDVKVSAFWNEHSGQSGICVGDHEIPLDQIDALLEAVTRAKRAADSTR